MDASARLRAAFARVESARVGLVTRVREHRAGAGFDGFFAFSAEVVVGGERTQVGGGGFERARAHASALGEAIERIGLRSVRSERLVAGSFAGLGERALDPARLLHYRDDVVAGGDLGIAPYTPTRPGLWYPAWNLSQEREQLVPACWVFNDWPAFLPAEARWDRPVSSGGAAHALREHAVLTGLHELIERDALMLHWEHLRPGRRRPAPAPAAAVVARLAARGFEVVLAELPGELGACVAVAGLVDVTGAVTRPALSVGAAARATWAAAAVHALEEAVMCAQWLSARQRFQPRGLAELRALLLGVPDPVVHAECYGHPAMRERAAFLWAGDATDADAVHGAPDAPESPADELAHLRTRLASLGHEILVADVTPPEIAGCGLVVVRVLCPGLVPLARGVRLRPLLHPRLRGAPGNPDPHPLP